MASPEERITKLEKSDALQSQRLDFLTVHVDDTFKEFKDSLKDGRNEFKDLREACTRIETKLDAHCENSGHTCGPIPPRQSDSLLSEEYQGTKAKDIVIRISTAGKPLASWGSIGLVLYYIIQQLSS